jgi:hypothetical protein
MMSFQRLAGGLAILAGIDGLCYSLAFAADIPERTALFLLLGDVAQRWWRSSTHLRDVEAIWRSGRFSWC